MIHLSNPYDDCLRVWHGDKLLGEVTPSGEDEWAAYRATDAERIVEKRVGTFQTIQQAIEALT